ncbi:unnamed protein product, partial [Polarella glacialis]
EGRCTSSLRDARGPANALSVSVVAAAVTLGCSGAADAAIPAADPGCPPASCCEGHCRFDHPMFTESYCCAGIPSYASAAGEKADCYSWGTDSPGNDVGEAVAPSGVACRHLCQATPDCAYWSYLAQVPELPENLRGRCFLKSQAALAGRAAAGHPFVVSGERLCAGFGEGMPLPLARGRTSTITGDGMRWRTAATSPGAQDFSAFLESLHTGTASPSRHRPSAASSGSKPSALLSSAGTASWAEEAAEVFDRLGFVAVVDALDAAAVARLKAAAKRAADLMLAHDPHRLGNRGPRRYSYGGASNSLHMLHSSEWAELFDIPAVTAVLQAVFGQGGYSAAGGGGDFVLNATDLYQNLHLDLGGGPIYLPGPPPAVAVNFVVEDLSCADGPLRVVPGTHRVQAEPPSLSDEPQEAKDALLCPLPAGTAIVRDLRAWHGGTPNAGKGIRYMPNAEFVNTFWGNLVCESGQLLNPCRPVMPRSKHEKLSEFGKALSAGLVDASGSLEGTDGGDWLDTDFAQVTRHRMEAF